MDNTVKKLAILGSTGSIGQQTLEVVRGLKAHFKVVALAAGRNTDLLRQQIREFQPDYYYCRSPKIEAPAKTGFLPLEEMAALPEVDTVVIATSGKAGLTATLAAARAGKKIAIANKEPLVMAGEIITRAVKKHHSKLLPVDSEHSAIWQCLQGEKKKPLRLILTASGGPFRALSRRQLAKVTPAQALQHPSWKMGKKVTIDSATLMNKGLEIIEARWLFDIDIDAITVLIHPQSIIHSMVEFGDGSIKAQMSLPDMRLPIQYALTYPHRRENKALPRFDWSQPPRLDLNLPEAGKFACLELAREAGKTGGTMPAVLCAADEVAVDLFLRERISFTAIPRLIAAVMQKHRVDKKPGIDTILEADARARLDTEELARKMKTW